MKSAFLFVKSCFVTFPRTRASNQMKARMTIHNFFKEHKYEQTR
jgi:hypothetical protein